MYEYNFYEEKIINGVWCFRCSPDSEWIKIPKILPESFLQMIKEGIEFKLLPDAKNAEFCMDIFGKTCYFRRSN